LIFSVNSREPREIERTPACGYILCRAYFRRCPMVSFAWIFFALGVGRSDFLSDMASGGILGELKKGGEEV